MEEEKKLVVARPKESLPFGMKIREAAHKAAFGGSKRGILQRYATFFQRKKGKEGAAGANDMDELLNDDDLSAYYLFSFFTSNIPRTCKVI